MFKKKLIATATTTAVMTSMFAGTVLADDATLPWDSNGGSATIEGSAYTVDPVISVELPGDLTFGINPLRLDADGVADTTTDKVQIVSGTYAVKNYSNVPVLVNAKTTAKVADGSTANLLSTATYDTNSKELEATTNKKNVFLLQTLPTAVTVDDAEAGTVSFTTGKIDDTITNADTAKAQAALVLGTTATDINFKLATYDGTLKPANVSGFKFDGAVDPSATFTEGEITVSTVFTLKTITDKEFGSKYVQATDLVTGVTDSVVKEK